MHANELINFTLDLAAILIILFTEIKIFSILSRTKIEYNIMTIIFILLFSLVVYLNGTYNYTLSKSFVYLFLLSIMNSIVFRKELSESLNVTCVFYVILMFSELLFSIFIMMIPDIQNAFEFDKLHILKSLYTLLNSFTLLLLFKIKWMRNKLLILMDRINNHKNKISIILVFAIITFIILLTFKNGGQLSFVDYMINIIFISMILFFVIMMTLQRLKINKFVEKQNVLLEFMGEYEKIIDKMRISNHEINNNLLLIKSLIDSENEEAISFIDNLLTENESENIISKDIYYLPAGLKGLFYYKLHCSLEEKININLYISRKVFKDLDMLDKKLFIRLHKILAILLDNALEASSNSKDKCLTIDIYKSKNYIIFNIENSYDDEMDFDKINNKNYSTKGSGKGLGLFIVKKLLKESNEFEMSQMIIDGKFITELKLEIK